MTTPPRIELYLRSLAPTTAREQQDDIVERLQELDEQGAIRGFEIVLCGDCVCPQSVTADSEPARRLLDRYDAFTEWERATDRELVGFETRETNALLTGTTITGIVFPRMALAEFRDGSLSFVAPSANGTEQTTVRERLERYASE